MAAANPARRPRPPLLDDACALFLDVDGTLIEFASRPEDVHLPAEVREAVGRLSERLGGALALVSGRPLAQLDALFAPLRLPAAGLHGHQVRGAGAGENAGAEPPPPPLRALRERAQRLADEYPGVLVEDKGVSLALHWRRAPEAGGRILAFARERIADVPGYRLQGGDHVVEFVPKGSDKGRAVEAMMRRPPFAGRLPVFVGDDLTDEFGFAAANRLGGWSVLVGDRADSAATHALAGPHAVHAWLSANAPAGAGPAGVRHS